MKKWKYFKWTDPNKSCGVGPALLYIKADTKKEAIYKLISKANLNHDPDFINGDVIEVDDFIQPKPIPIVV